MRSVSYLHFALFLILTNSDDRFPCHWDTACMVACRQLAWIYIRLVINGKGHLLEHYCLHTLDYTRKGFPDHNLQPEICDDMLGAIVGDKDLIFLAKAYTGKFDQNGKDYYNDIYVNHTMDLCAKGVCGYKCD
ncbi:hypothetical protein Aduo_000181 [Ancylostoma duodenale]